MKSLPPKSKQFAIDFARFCIDTNLYPKQAMKICILAHELYEAIVRECNEKDFNTEHYYQRFVNMCDDCGIDYDISTPVPYIKTDEYRHIPIPSYDE